MRKFENAAITILILIVALAGYLVFFRGWKIPPDCMTEPENAACQVRR